MTFPTEDGQVLPYRATSGCSNTPRIYYVNGIRTDGQAHAATAMELSRITEREITGVYNLTEWGGVKDLWECLYEWVASVQSQSLEWLLSLRPAGVLQPTLGLQLAAQFFTRLPEATRLEFADFWLSNVASRVLFHRLRAHRTERQMIVAHSQGNLVTCDAMWTMVMVYGQQSLREMRVYSLASPVPAWPAGLDHRRKEYGHENDFVTLLRPQNASSFVIDRARPLMAISPALSAVVLADELSGHRFGRSQGDWRIEGSGWVGLAGHDVMLNMHATNFANGIRRDLGLPPLPSCCGAPGCPGHSDPSHRCVGGP